MVAPLERVVEAAPEMSSTHLGRQAMTVRLGVRREDRNEWERRVPLAPEHIGQLIGEHGATVRVQTSSQRVFPDHAYASAGAEVVATLDGCPVIVAVKEVPIPLLAPKTTYLYFAHVVKGQLYNLPMLRRLLDLGCDLLDYERIVDATGKRLIAFGRFAGQAGLVETLVAFSRKLDLEGLRNPLAALRQPMTYRDLGELHQALDETSRRIAAVGFPYPVVCGITGYGQVSNGVQELLELLPVETLEPEELLLGGRVTATDRLYKVVFQERHLAEPLNPGKTFDLQEYFTAPDRYRGIFQRYHAHLTLLLNCIYWEPRFPRLCSRADLRSGLPPHALRIIGDISCDLDGAIEINRGATTPGQPCYTYRPATDDYVEGVAAEGITVMAVDNLPCELPAEASRHFGDLLVQFLPGLLAARDQNGLKAAALPPELHRALIVHNGKLTPTYSYLHTFLETTTKAVTA